MIHRENIAGFNVKALIMAAVTGLEGQQGCPVFRLLHFWPQAAELSNHAHGLQHSIRTFFMSGHATPTY
jgi:hypothetical protein